MICILKFGRPVSDHGHLSDMVTGWIIAEDIPSARRAAEAAFEHDLAAELYKMEFTPTVGKHILKTGHVLLAG